MKDFSQTYHHHCKPGCGPHICEGCSRVFDPRRSDQRFCSDICRAEVWKAQQNKRCSYPDCPNRALAGLKSEFCEMHYRRQKEGRPMDVPRKGSRLTCLVEGCERKPYARGLCEMHHRRMVKYGEPGPVGSTIVRQQSATCTVEGCDRAARAQNLCGMHWQRMRTKGEPGLAQPIRRPAGQGSFSQGYIDVSQNGKRRLQHRIVMEDILGRPLGRLETVHHRNGLRADNRPENLELRVSHPSGQRVEDLVQFVVEHYPKAAEAALRGKQLDLELFA